MRLSANEFLHRQLRTVKINISFINYITVINGFFCLQTLTRLEHFHSIEQRFVKQAQID
jgi:hypothetical protein